MPNASSYISGFRLRKLLKELGLKEEVLDVGHEEVIRYRRYEYPTNIVLTADFDDAEALKKVRQLADELNQKHEEILSGYGNPYDCNFGTIIIKETIDKKIELEARGVCVRVFKNQRR